MKKSSEEQGSRIRSGLAGACVMVLLTAGLLWGSEAWYRAAFGKYETRVAPYGTVTAEQELPLPAYAADYGVRRLAAGRDASGALLAYAVETAVEGYAGREIVIRAEIQADGELLREMRPRRRTAITATVLRSTPLPSALRAAICRCCCPVRPGAAPASMRCRVPPAPRRRCSGR